MWDYSDTVKEHFYNPRNSGAVKDANATGDVGSLSCGDALRLTLKVDPETEIIQEAGFQTFGCGSAIASSSALTEIIKGKTLDEALQVSNQDIADYLEGLPPEKMHCSVMGREALQAAVANYRGEVWKDDHEEGALVCKCFAVDAVLIEDTIRANNLSTITEVAHYTKAGGGCSSCHEKIEEILTTVMAERGETFVPEGAAKAKPKVVQLTPKSEPQPSKPVALSSQPKLKEPGPSRLTYLERVKRIEKVIEKVKPNVQADGGDIELIEVTDKKVFVKLTGACNGCQLAALTLNGVQQKIMEDLGEFIQVLPADQLVGA